MKILTESSLLFWLLCFMLGILLFESPFVVGFTLFSIFLMLSALVFRKKLENFQFYLLFGPLFTLSGYLMMNNYYPLENKELGQVETFYTGKIVEQMSNDKTWNSALVELQSIRKNKTWEPTSEKVLLVIENSGITYAKNDLLLFNGIFNTIQVRNNPGEFNATMYWLSKGVRYQAFIGENQIRVLQTGALNWLENVLEQSRNYSNKMLEEWIGEADAPLIKAILLGDKSDIDIQTKRAFINTGTMHMLAVSGLHIGVIVMLLGLFFKYLFFHRGRHIASIIMLVTLWFYAFLTGFSASVVRAVVMFSILILARFINRDYQPINALSLSAFVILLINPLSIYDIGFQLSYLAMVGIFVYYPLLESVLTIKNKFITTVWQGPAVGLAAQVFTVPISLYYFYQFPNYFFLSNLGVMLFSGIMLGFSIALLLIGKVAIIAAPVGWILALSCVVFVGFIAWIETFYGAVALGFSPSVWWVLLTYILVLIAIQWVERLKWIWVGLGVLPLLVWIQLERYDNLNKQEWLIFNTNHPTLLINNAGQQMCFYGGGEKGKKNALRLVDDYQKLHPGKVEFLPLEKGVYQVFSNQKNTLQIINKISFLEIKYKNDSYALVVNNSIKELEEFSRKSKLITMQPLEVAATFHDLSKGALRVEL
ncbi:MAG: ComEC/Rec2 family competence protein [Crocinitomicaceae bacterium]